MIRRTMLGQYRHLASDCSSSLRASRLGAGDARRLVIWPLMDDYGGASCCSVGQGMGIVVTGDPGPAMILSMGTEAVSPMTKGLS